MGSKSSPPPSPDYTKAAEATAAGNRVNQFTPFGNLTYSQAGKDAQGNPIWNQNIQLSPVQQKLFDSQNNTSLQLAGLQGQGVEGVKKLFDNMPSMSNLPASPINAGQTAQDAIMARVQPMLDRQQDRMNNQLANQGIQVGSEAYKNAQMDFGRQANDAYSQAALQGIDEGYKARQQGMNEQGFYSQLPINLLNAVRTGSQMQSPQFGGTPQGANYLGAAQNQGQAALNAYNTQVGAQNSFTNGLMSLGGALLLGSDRRLKEDIKPIGVSDRGNRLYSFRYKDTGAPAIGVMADEVEHIPGAVYTRPDGFKMVDYSKV